MPNNLKPEKKQFSILQPPKKQFSILQPPQKPNFQLATGESITAPKPNLESLRATGAQSATLSRPAGTAVLPPPQKTTPKLTQNEKTLASQPVAPRTPSGLTLGQAEAIQQVQPQPTAVQQTSVQPAQQIAKPQPSQLEAIQQKLQGTFGPTPEEVTLQQQLNDVLTSEELGINQIRNQPIAMPFITGQAAAVQRQASAQATPLQRQLALLQAQRTGQREGLQSQLDFEQSQQTEPAAGFTLGKDQVRYDSEGNVIATGLGGGTTEGGVSGVAQDWANLVNSGKAKLSDVPSDIRSQVASSLGALPTEQSLAQKRASDQANTALTAIDNALGIIPEISTGAFGRALTSFIPGSEARDLNAQLTTVKALIGFDQLQKMREASPTGGALGQVSERELAFLQSVAGSLDTGQSTEQLVGTLGRIKESFQRLRAISNPTITPEEYLQQFPDATDEELAEIIQKSEQSFNNVGADTNQGIVEIPQSSRLAFVNNNPGNLRFAGQEGAVQGEGGFARFSTPEAGYQALKNQIQLDAGRGFTLAQFINKYAPPSENDTQQYIQQITQLTGANPNTPIQQIDLNTLARAIAQKESSTQIYA